ATWRDRRGGPAQVKSLGGRLAVTWFVVVGFVSACGTVGPSGSEAEVLEATDVPDQSSAVSPSPAIAMASTGTGASGSPAASPAGSASPGASAASGPVVPFRLTARAFIEGGAIPREYTCDGDNVSPALSWSGVPAGAASLVLLVDDPSAKGFVHWIVLDLPAEPAGALPRALEGVTTPPRQRRNDFGNVGWSCPCPPSGTRQYQCPTYRL